MFTHLSSTLPLKYLRKTDTLVAFYHPQPSYPVHILLVPKKSIASLSELDENDNDFLHDLFQTVQSLICELELTKVGYRLIVNGGSYQDIPLLHFHLISEEK
jgi:histidine triad (HIT) family protein